MFEIKGKILFRDGNVMFGVNPIMKNKTRYHFLRYSRRYSAYIIRNDVFYRQKGDMTGFLSYSLLKEKTKHHIRLWELHQ